MARSISAHVSAEGDLIVEGHDLSDEAGSAMGYREYEWSITVAAADAPKLLRALNARRFPFGLLQRRRKLLDALRSRFPGDLIAELEPFLKERGIPYAFWNRIGD